MSISEDLGKLAMAGLGAATLATEKTQDALESLSKRGEEAFAQGKDLNERLRHEIDRAADTVSEKISKDDILAALDNLTPEERVAVKTKLAEMDVHPTDGQSE